MKTTKVNSQLRLKTVLVRALMLTTALFVTPLATVVSSSLPIHAFWSQPLEASFKEEATNLQSGQEIWIAQANGNTSVAEILAAHNKYRSQLGLTSLTWSNNLANSAQDWAGNLAATGQFYHSSTGYGENIWWGTSGNYSFTQMVDTWGSEKQYFRYGIFPNVSSTGSWYDVGHYTQIIWRNTTEVGCGFASGNGYDVLVCQYNPSGNYTGETVY